MKVDQEIFKTYDVRGVFPDQLTEEVTKLIALGFIKEFNPKSAVVGYDARLGSKPTFKYFIDTLLENGIDVIDIGFTSTPRLYFATDKYQTDAGVIITASHAPPDQTGVKFTVNGYPPTPEQMINIRKFVQESEKYIPQTGIEPGEHTEKSEEEEYVKEIRQFVKDPFKPFKVVIDCGNSVNGPIARKVFDGLGFGEITYLFEDIDGNFPNHGVNPKLKKNRIPLEKKVKEVGADIGIIWDGDSDRVYLIDHKGEVISPHFVSALIGEYLIPRSEGDKMTVEVRTSKVVKDLVEKVGGEVMTIPAWHTEIKYAMEKDPQIVFGSETSGHYVFRDFYSVDDGVLTALVFIAAISVKDKSLTEILDDFKTRYFVTEETNYSIPDNAEEIYKVLDKKYPEAEKLWIDGVTITYSDWRFNLRASQTEPVIRLNLSASSQKLLDDKVKEVTDVIYDMGGKDAES